MKKVLIIFGLYHTLIEFDRREYSRSPELLVMPKDGCEDFLSDLRKIKRMYKGIDFHIMSNLERGFIKVFLDKTKSRDIFNQDLDLRFKPSTITNRIYSNFWHKILKCKSKRVLEIQGYDKVILIDCNVIHRLDFLSLKFKKIFMKKSKANKKIIKGLWSYIYPKTFDSTKRQLEKLIEKENGIRVK